MLSKEKEETVRLAEWILVKEHRMRLLSDLAFSIITVLIFLILKLLLANDLLVIQVDIE